MAPQLSKIKINSKISSNGNKGADQIDGTSGIIISDNNNTKINSFLSQISELSTQKWLGNNYVFIKISSIIFMVLSLVSLFLPWYNVRIFHNGILIFEANLMPLDSWTILVSKNLILGFSLPEAFTNERVFLFSLEIILLSIIITIRVINFRQQLGEENRYYLYIFNLIVIYGLFIIVYFLITLISTKLYVPYLISEVQENDEVFIKGYSISIGLILFFLSEMFLIYDLVVSKHIYDILLLRKGEFKIDLEGNYFFSGPTGSIGLGPKDFLKEKESLTPTIGLGKESKFNSQQNTPYNPLQNPQHNYESFQVVEDKIIKKMINNQKLIKLREKEEDGI
ncbi:MAG: hypothetical protein ACTSU2_03145 [Promethearchaeota archaeon]